MSASYHMPTIRAMQHGQPLPPSIRQVDLDPGRVPIPCPPYGRRQARRNAVLTRCLRLVLLQRQEENKVGAVVAPRTAVASLFDVETDVIDGFEGG